VPQSLRQTTEVSLTAEIYSQGTATFGLEPFSDTVVLDQTFNDVDLVGHPITIGNDLTQAGTTAAAFTTVTNTYSPYLQIGDAANRDPSQDPIIEGTEYQEVLTNLPLGSDVLTGLFLTVTLGGAGGSPQTYQKTLADRIGYAARQGLGPPLNVNVSPTDPPLVGPFDAVTLALSPSIEPASVLVGETGALAQLGVQLQAAAASTTGAGSGPTSDALMHRFSALATAHLADVFLATSDVLGPSYDRSFLTRSYFDVPRIVAVTDTFTATEPAELKLELDLLREVPRVYAAPGQALDAVQAATGIRGFVDSIIEDQLASLNKAQPNTQASSAYGTFFAALDAGEGLVTITSGNIGTVSALPISAEAKARITNAAAAGEIVLVPAGEVTVSGKPTIAWLEFDPNTGFVIAVGEDGAHNLTEAQLARVKSVLITVGTTTGGGVLLATKFITSATYAEAQETFPAAELEGQTYATNLTNIVNMNVQQLRNLAQQGNTVAFRDAVQEVIDLYRSWFPPTAGGPPPGTGGPPPAAIDPPLTDELNGLPAVSPLADVGTATEGISQVGSAGAAAGSLAAVGLSVSGQLNAQWNSAAMNVFQVSSLTASTAMIIGTNGAVLGTGVIALSGGIPVTAVLSGNNSYSVQGVGNLSFYGPAESDLGVSGNWDNYSATVTGRVSITLTTDSLTLNGQSLPGGTYTITTSSAGLSGSGQSSSPDFAGSASIAATNATVTLGAGNGNVTIGGKPLTLTNGGTLDGYTGNIAVTGGGTNGTDAVTLNGNAANVLTVSAVPNALTTDQNTPVMFQVNVNTSFVGAYNITATAPPGWTVAVGSNGLVAVTPAPGVQGGVYPIQVVAKSTTNANLTAQTTIDVTITPTAPGLNFSVPPDTEFTLPFNGAQLPTAFRASLQNLGPAADTYKLTFANVPARFTLRDSGTSVSVPAGQTGILGLYLQPNAGTTLPAPGTQLSFEVTATSVSNPAITQTVTVTFTMPALHAVSVSDAPTQVNTLPGVGGTTTLTLQNVGNVSESEAVLATSSPGLTVSGLSSPVSLGIGASATQTLTLTPAATTPLNSTLQASITVGPAATANTVSVVNVTPSASFVAAGQTVTLSAAVLNGVTQTEQAQVSFTVLNSSNAVVITSTAVPVTLSTVTNVATVNLGSLSTSTLAPGQYTIQVSVANSNGTPIPGATGTASLVIDAPVTASLTVNSDAISPADSNTIFNTLTVGSQTLLGSVATDGAATSVALNGSLAYVANTQDIAVVNVSDPTNPQVVTTFGSSDLTQGGLNLLELDGNNLVVASGNPSDNSSFKLLVYSLANPSSPQLLGSTTIPYAFPAGLVVQGNTAFIPIQGTSNDGNGNITDQFGDFLAVDLSNPAAPQLAGVLFNNRGSPQGSDSNEWAAVPINSQVTYVAGSTSTGADTQTGTGRVLIVNRANPAAMSLASHLDIPGTVHALAIAVNGNEALVVGSTGGYQSPVSDPSQLGLTGNVTLTLMNISNPLAPTIIGSTVVTQDTFPNVGQNATGTLQAVYLGNNQFAVSDTQAGIFPVILVVNASDPTNLTTSTVAAPSDVNGLTVSGDRVLATSGGGLALYQIGALNTQSVTASVTVPTTGTAAVVPGSFTVQPNQVIPGNGTETLVWDLTLAPGSASQQITWATRLDGLAAGQVAAVTTGAIIRVGNQEFTLPASNVAGIPETQTITIPVDVVAPGVTAIANAAVAAGQSGNTNLADRLTDLSTALTNLVQAPTSAVYQSEVQASLTAIEGLLGADHFLAALVPALTADGTTLAQASTASAVQSAVSQLGNDLTTLAQTISDEAAHGFTFSLAPNSALILANSPAAYGLVLHNAGSQATTYDLAVSGLPANVTAKFVQNGQTVTHVTLQPGQSIFADSGEGGNGVTLELTESGGSLFPSGFTVTVTAEGAPEITLSTPGVVTVRPSQVVVSAVDASPPFTNPGPTVDVKAHLLVSINQPEQLKASYTVSDPSGSTVFTSTPVTVTLTVQTTLDTVDLGSFPTTGLADGSYTIEVNLTDSSGQALPGGTGQGSVLIGTPVAATLSTSPPTLPPGNGTVTTTLQVNAVGGQGTPLSASVTVPTSNGVSIVPGSFNVAPTTITQGAGSETLTWSLASSATTLYITQNAYPPGIDLVNLNTNTVTQLVDTDATGDSLIFDKNGDIVYDTYRDPGEIGIFDPHTNTNTIIASNYYALKDMVLQPGGNSVLIADDGDSEILSLDLNTSAITVFASGLPGINGLAYDSNGNLFAVDVSDDALLQLDPASGAVLQTIALPASADPDGMTYDAGTNSLWIADEYAGVIQVSNYLTSPQVQEFSMTMPAIGFFDGIESDGQGNLYIAESNGFNPGRIDEYNIAVNTYTPLTSVSLDDLAPITGLGAPSNNTFTWQSTVTNLQSGEVRPVTSGATVAFTSGGNAGTLTLPGTTVTGQAATGVGMSLSPPSQTVAPVSPASYTVTVTNPGAASDTFDLAVLGVPPNWVSLPVSVTVAANSSTDVTLTLTSDAFAALGDHGFTVTANAGAGATGYVQGDLILSGSPPAVDPNSHGIVVTLTPSQASAGQGTSVQYVVQLTNTGSSDDTFSPSAAGLPAGISAAFSQTSIDVPPGASNFRDVTLTLTPAVDTPAGKDPFTVTAASTTLSAVTGTAHGTLTVLGTGVSVWLNPPSGGPGTAFQMTVTNTGTASDTFDLSLGGPAGMVSTLATTQVTLAAGASQTVPITLGNLSFALPGPLTLMGIARSHGNPAVAAQATASISIASRLGLSGSFSPSVQVLPVPGTADFLLQVNNTGNVEDAYSATITGTSGPVTADLVDLQGQPAQSIPVFRLPGLSTGAILLHSDLVTGGSGSVTVKVTSLTDSSMTVSSTAQVSAPINGFEYSPLSSYPLGNFTQGDGSEPPSNFHVTINWGDGSPSETSSGQVTEINGIYTVTGTHTYDDESYQEPGHVYTVTAQVSDGTTAKMLGTTANIVEALLPDGTRGTANERFIAEVYRDLLGRAVDAGGLQGWVALLNAGMSRVDVVRAIENAPGNEYRFHLVDQLYRQFLHRASAGDPGAAGWVGLLAGGSTLEQVEAGILGSPEYYQTRGSGSAAGWLNAVYQDLFHRPVDANGQGSWLGAARAGSLSDVALAILTAPAQGSAASNEYRAHLVDALYQQLLDRSSQGDAGAVGWAELLQGGQRYEDVVAGIVGDPQEVEFFGKISS
jgi:uncharacterized membrane protein